MAESSGTGAGSSRNAAGAGSWSSIGGEPPKFVPVRFNELERVQIYSPTKRKYDCVGPLEQQYNARSIGAYGHELMFPRSVGKNYGLSELYLQRPYGRLPVNEFSFQRYRLAA